MATQSGLEGRTANSIYEEAGPPVPAAQQGGGISTAPRAYTERAPAYQGSTYQPDVQAGNALMQGTYRGGDAGRNEASVAPITEGADYRNLRRDLYAPAPSEWRRGVDMRNARVGEDNPFWAAFNQNRVANDFNRRSDRHASAVTSAFDRAQAPQIARDQMLSAEQTNMVNAQAGLAEQGLAAQNAYDVQNRASLASEFGSNNILGAALDRNQKEQQYRMGALDLAADQQRFSQEGGMLERALKYGTQPVGGLAAEELARTKREGEEDASLQEVKERERAKKVWDDNIQAYLDADGPPGRIASIRPLLQSPIAPGDMAGIVLRQKLLDTDVTEEPFAQDPAVNDLTGLELTDYTARDMAGTLPLHQKIFGAIARGGMAPFSGMTLGGTTLNMGGRVVDADLTDQERILLKQDIDAGLYR